MVAYPLGMVDDAMGPASVGDEDWTLGEMTMGEYRQMAARIEAEGRDAFSGEELARFDAAHEQQQAVARQVWASASGVMTDVSDALRKVRETAMEPTVAKRRQEVEESMRERMSGPSVVVPPVDEEWMDSVAEVREEERARQVAQVEALEAIAGHMAEMKVEQRATTSEVGELRTDGRRTSRWTVVSAVAAVLAAVFGALALFLP